MRIDIESVLVDRVEHPPKADHAVDPKFLANDKFEGGVNEPRMNEGKGKDSRMETL